HHRPRLDWACRPLKDRKILIYPFGVTKKKGPILIGAGSLSARRGIWWMTYMNADNVRIQRSTGTRDRAEAERMLARTTLPLIEAKVAQLRAIAYGREADSNPAHAPGRRPSRRSR